MGRLALIVVVLVVLLGGGAVTAMFSANGAAQQLPAAMVQVGDPEASVFTATEWQAQQFFLLIGFIFINLIGIGATLAAVFWFLHRQIAEAKQSDGKTVNATE